MNNYQLFASVQITTTSIFHEKGYVNNIWKHNYFIWKTASIELKSQSTEDSKKLILHTVPLHLQCSVNSSRLGANHSSVISLVWLLIWSFVLETHTSESAALIEVTIPFLSTNQITLSPVLNWHCTLTPFTALVPHLCERPDVVFNACGPLRKNDILISTVFGPCSHLWSAKGGSSLYWPPELVRGAPGLTGDEVVAQSIQAAGDVGQTHGCLDEQADLGLTAAVLNHFPVHLGPDVRLDTVDRENICWPSSLHVIKTLLR